MPKANAQNIRRRIRRIYEDARLGELLAQDWSARKAGTNQKVETAFRNARRWAEEAEWLMDAQ